MARPSVEHHKRPRRQHLEPLISKRREDGLWQSIERDEEELASHFQGPTRGSVSGSSSVTIKDDGGHDHDMKLLQPPRDISTVPVTIETPDVPPKPDIKPDKTEAKSTSHCPEAPSAAGLSARALACPLPHAGILSTPQASAPGPAHQPRTTPPPRRRGRPRKSRNAPNWNRRRTVRFSDPVPAEREPQADPGPTHVFVRLTRIIVAAHEDPALPQGRHEAAWNNRAKGWRLAGDTRQCNIDDIGRLFDKMPGVGPAVRVLLVPTAGRGAWEPVEMAWDGAACCFRGSNEDIGTLVVALGEVRDMVRDPWARQFVGYVFE